MSNQHADDLIGTNLGEFTLQELVGEGTFSHVFRGVNRNQSEKAIKVPRRFSNAKEDGGADYVPTQVFLKKAKRFTPQEASPIHILRIQIARTKGIHDHGLVRVEDYSFAGDRTFSRMPLLLGRTLRDYMRSGPVPISVIRNIALTLERLSRIEHFNYHGDVKPENMIVTANGVVMVDCGYFGNVQVDEAIDKDKSLIVTTPRYYPLLKPDDLLALGLIVWEIACRSSLLSGVAYSGDYDTEHIADDLVECVAREEALGNFNFTQVLGAEMPSTLRSGMPPRVEALLLKAVRLKVTKGGVLTLDEGFDNFEHFADDLKKLTQEGIHYL